MEEQKWTHLVLQLKRPHFVNQMDCFRGYVNLIEQSIVSCHSCSAGKSFVDKIHFAVDKIHFGAGKMLDSHRLDSPVEPIEHANLWNRYGSRCTKNINSCTFNCNNDYSGCYSKQHKTWK